MAKPIHPLKTCGHFTSAESTQIEILHRTGEGPTGIARLIEWSKSTVSVELRGLGPAEDYSAAAAGLASIPGRLTAVTEKAREKIRSLPVRGWSPQRIAGRWRSGLEKSLEGMVPLSHETIYGIIAADRAQGGNLWQMPRRRGKKARRDRTGARRGHRLKVGAEEELADRLAISTTGGGPAIGRLIRLLARDRLAFRWLRWSG